MYVKYFDILKVLFLWRKRMNYVKTIWALLPPVIAIIFALKTKEVYISLLIGIVSGTLLPVSYTHLTLPTT